MFTRRVIMSIKPGSAAEAGRILEGDTALFTGHATVKSRFKGRDFGSLYRLSRKYEQQQGRWRIIASKTARLGDE